MEEARFRDKLNTEYQESPYQGYFGGDYKKLVFPDFFEALG
jgi:hypothetical protein